MDVWKRELGGYWDLKYDAWKPETVCNSPVSLVHPASTRTCLLPRVSRDNQGHDCCQGPQTATELIHTVSTVH